MIRPASRAVPRTLCIRATLGTSLGRKDPRCLETTVHRALPTAPSHCVMWLAALLAFRIPAHTFTVRSASTKEGPHEFSFPSCWMSACLVHSRTELHLIYTHILLFVPNREAGSTG